MSPIAITGATGFIGKHLVSEFRKNKIKTRALIYVYDKRSTCQADKIFYGDLVKSKGLEPFLSGTEMVVNLVGSFYPPFEKQLETNVLALNNLCEAALKCRVKKIIHISAMAAYGAISKKRLLTEKDKLAPNTQYSLAKKLAEEIAGYYHRIHGLSFVILRPPNVYGPGSDHGVVFNFLKSIKENGKVIIFGDGKQERDFLYISDFIEAIIKAIRYEAKYEVFNVGAGKSYNLLELVSLLEKIVGKKISIEFKDKKDYSVKVLLADIKKAKSELKWYPKVSLEEGLRKTLGNN